MRESPLLSPQSRRAVLNWQQYFGAQPADVRQAMTDNGWTQSTVVTKQAFMESAAIPDPVIDYLRPQRAILADVVDGLLILHVFGRGFGPGSQIILDANAVTDPEDPDSGPQVAAETQVISPFECQCALPSISFTGPYAIAVRTPYRGDSNHVVFTITAATSDDPKEPELPDREHPIEPTPPEDGTIQPLHAQHHRRKHPHAES